MLFSPRKQKHLGVPSEWIRGYKSVFLVNLLITTLLANNHLLPPFLASISIPILYSIPSESLRKDFSSSSWLVKVFDFRILIKFNGLQFCYSVFQWQISSTEIYLSLLLQSFQIVVRSVGGGIRNFTGQIFLPSEGNLRRSDFDNLNLFKS